MNKLVIIGNGFDLAHGLKTKYSDFVLWYLNKKYIDHISYLKHRNNNFDKELENDLLVIKGNGYLMDYENFKSINEFNDAVSGNNTGIEHSHYFFKHIIQSLEYNWVDIELEYYKFLKEIYKAVEKSNTGQVSNSTKEELMKLNQCLDVIKKELEEYLSTIKTEKWEVDLPPEMKILFDNWSINDQIENNGENIYFLNFNYTNTIFNYTNNLFGLKKSIVNYIHGKINDNYNPIIFGYGDETDKNYEKIEDLNENEFTRHFKSFSYLLTSNYQDLFEYLGKDEFEVHIMGHSCGLSDRVLFNHIFEHDNFKKVQLYYYQFGEKNYENDFFQKTQELSRHFKLNSKHRMRTRIVPFDESSPLTKFNPQN